MASRRTAASYRISEHLSTSGRRLQSFSFWLGCASPWVESFEKGQVRGVAQSGSALDWGSRGRRFESGRPDHFGSIHGRSSRRGLRVGSKAGRGASG
jgi:hypothetical protein